MFEPVHKVGLQCQNAPLPIYIIQGVLRIHISGGGVNVGAFFNKVWISCSLRDYDVIINYGDRVHKTYAETMLEYDVQHLHVRRKEHLIMNMFLQRNNPEYGDMNRPDRLLRNHDGTKFKIRATRNQKVYKSPYFRGVQLWERLPNVTWTLQGRKEFKHSIKGIEL